ncbi:hypothetical protein MNBD_GAMMA12-1630 [hydrothermal vent metagenome]|uniref:Acyltransferase 3 domain-containing protein n=1 Tax=hydrothermal vent metagenome TaxID=652676 RepID=A0A3B0YNW7_9ZZZZ
MVQTTRTFDLKQNNFDLLRLLAAMQVVLSHSMHHLEIKMSIPFLGVSIFYYIGKRLVNIDVFLIVGLAISIFADMYYTSNVARYDD